MKPNLSTDVDTARLPVQVRATVEAKSKQSLFIMDGPSAVYYDFSGHHIDGGQNQLPEATPRQCSVRGCTQFVTDGLNNKMCDACRGRHRIYATTKRARRKLEKAAVANSVLPGGNALALIHESNSAIVVEKDHAAPNIWMESGQIIMDQGNSMAHSQVLSHQNDSIPYWDQDMDPLLKEGMPIQTVVQPHQRSTESELAHALTYAPPRVHTQPETAAGPPLTSTGGTGTAETTGGPSNQQTAFSIQIPQEQSSTNEAVNQNQEKAKGMGEPTRYCSVKGCKAVIGASYEFKMCPQCRVRYRTYGTTKRAKWKHERESFQQEMESLRTIEDEKRKARGLRPLSDNPEELRAWELSVIDEQVPLPAVENLGSLTSLAGAISVGMPSTTQPEASTNFSAMPAGDTYAVSVSSIDIANPVSPYPHLNMAYSGSPVAPPPARMCTVSHCHKILPGFYRFKRCEQHRLQNRYHSQLKRVREKGVKAAGPDQSMQAMDASSEMTEGSSAMSGSGVDQCVVNAMRDRRLKMLRKRKRAQPTKKAKSSVFVDVQDAPTEYAESGGPVAEGCITGEASSWDFPVGEEQNPPEDQVENHDADYNQSSTSANTQHQSTSFVQAANQSQTLFMNTDGKHHANTSTAKKRQLSKFSCASTDCHNLLTPGIRWRMCEDCRAIERQRRTHERREARESSGGVSAGNLQIMVNGTSYAHPPQNNASSVGQAVTATGANGLAENIAHGFGTDAEADSQSDADADAEGDEDGEGEVDVGQAIELPQAPTARVAPGQTNPSQGRPLIWKTNAPDDSAPWASGFSKFRVEKPRPPTVSKNADNQSTLKALKPKPLLTSNDGTSTHRHSPSPVDSVANSPDVGSSKQTNLSAGQQGGDSVAGRSAPLPTSTIPTSEPPASVAPSTQSVVSPSGPVAVSSKAQGKRKAASEDTVNSNSAPPPPIPVASGSFSAPYGYPSSYPYYPYYMPSYLMPPYPYAPGMSGPGGPVKDHLPPGVPPLSGPPAYPPYPYHSSQNHHSHHPPHSHPHPPPPLPPHAQSYGFGPPPGLPYLPPRYTAPPWGQPSHQVPYGAYPPPPRPSNGPSSYSHYPPAFSSPSQSSAFHAPAFNQYQPNPEPPPSTATKKKRSKANNYESSAQPSRGQNVTIPSAQTLGHIRSVPAIAPGSAPLPVAISSDCNQTSVALVDQELDVATNSSVHDDTANRDTRQCTTCKRALTPACHGTICDKCKHRFKKHQMKAKQKFKLEPRKFLREMKPSTATSQESGHSEEDVV